MSWSEDRLHLWLARGTRPRGLWGSRGHDAAALFGLHGRAVVCVDQCVEGVHFERSAPAGAVGRKAAARAISDLAATAARPRALLLALTAPADRSEAWLKGAIAGVRRMARSAGADLVGGDLCARAGPVHLSVTAIGAFRYCGRTPGRDRARVGQIVLLTGPVGGSLLGRHLRIRPRVEEGIWLFERGARALMDVSDGLAWDAYRLARASGVAIEIDADRVPVHADARRLARRSGRSALDHALHDGEDHELIATVGKGALARILRESAAHCPGLRAIGRVVRGSGVWLVEGDGGRARWTPDRGGFRHGR